MAIVNSENIGGLIQRTLNRVDSRLVDHGIQVAYLTEKMLEAEGTRPERERRDICFLALLHDVGAYKTEEISQMLQFETEGVWQHSIYGYLFLHHLSPIRELAPAVLFHHTIWSALTAMDAPHKDLAQILGVADRADVILGAVGGTREKLLNHLRTGRGARFSPEAVDLFLEADRRWDLGAAIRGPLKMADFVPQVGMEQAEIDAYLDMLIYAIDFRSRHTVTHTITTAGISDALARRMGMDGGERLQVHYGAMLHDLGKIGVPVEILEYPGKLGPAEMAVMRTHVDITEKILGGVIDPVTTNIALRHHEKLDGSGYPRGLAGAELTTGERIVAVADMASALLGTRSYKEAYSKERALGILRESAEAGRVDAGLVALLEEGFDEIMAGLQARYAPVLGIYRGLDREYRALFQKYAVGVTAG